MQKICSKTVFFYILLLLALSYTVQSRSQTGVGLLEKVARNKELFRTNIDKAFHETEPLLKEAIRVKDDAALAALLENRCKYYYGKQLPDSLATEAKRLYAAASAIKDPYRLLMANIYLAEVYTINRLYDKAIVHLNENLAITEGADAADARLFFGRINTLTSFANLYNDKGEYGKAVRTIKGIIGNYELLKNPEDIRKYQYVNYSNLAGSYYHFNRDSAAFFARKSNGLQPRSGYEHIRTTNLLIMGKAAKEAGQYATALKYLQEAEKLSEKTGEKLNMEEIYTHLADLYSIQKMETERLLAENKLKDLKVEQLNSRNESLYKMLSEPPQKKKEVSLYVMLLFLMLIGIAAAVVLYYRKKNRLLVEPSIPTFDELIEMVRKDDPAYLPSFEKAYPDFSKKLLNIDPALSASEIEFCSLLRLNLSTKKIAQLKFIEIRTVQNKKYRIRKKLQIPAETDLYNWFACNA